MIPVIVTDEVVEAIRNEAIHDFSESGIQSLGYGLSRIFISDEIATKLASINPDPEAALRQLLGLAPQKMH